MAEEAPKPAGNTPTSLLQNRMVLIGGGIALGVIVLLFILIRAMTSGGSDKYITLYSRLDLKDSAKIIESLEEQGIRDFRLQDKGTTIRYDSHYAGQ